MPFEEALKYFKSMGIQMVEIGCGGFPGKDHCDPEVLLNDEAKFQEFCDVIKKYDMEVSAFSCHGNPVHPEQGARRGVRQGHAQRGPHGGKIRPAPDQLLLRLPRRQRDLAVSELGHLPWPG